MTDVAQAVATPKTEATDMEGPCVACGAEYSDQARVLRLQKFREKMSIRARELVRGVAFIKDNFQGKEVETLVDEFVRDMTGRSE